MAIRTHFCDVDQGESINTQLQRENVLVDLSSQTTLYSGRVFYRNSSRMAIGGAYTGTQLYVAYYGVESPFVKGPSAVLSSATGGLSMATSGQARISGIPIRPGLVILTTEYDTTDTWSPGDPVRVMTTTADGDGGKLDKATAYGNLDVVGECMDEGTNVNAAYNSTRSLLRVRFLRAAQGLN